MNSREEAEMQSLELEVEWLESNWRKVRPLIKLLERAEKIIEKSSCDGSPKILKIRGQWMRDAGDFLEGFNDRT